MGAVAASVTALPARPWTSPAGGAARSRLLGGDAVRALAMIAVVCIHASAWGPRHPFATVSMLARFSVPAFMVLTGVVLAYQHAGHLGPHFMRRRLGRSVLPWLVWAPMFVLFDFVTGALTPSGAAVGNFLTQGAGHLWFLLLIPQLYVLFMLWPRRHRWAIAALALLLQTALCLLRIYLVLPGWQEQVMLTYSSEIFPFWIGYFALGVALGGSLRQPGALRRAATVWRVQLAGAAALGTAGGAYLLLTLQYPGAPYAHSFLRGTGAFLNPVLPLLVCSVCALLALTLPLVMRRWRPVLRAVSVLSEQSLGIYIVHPILLFLFAMYVMQPWLAEGGTMARVAAALLIVLTLLSALVASRLLSATPVARALGGSRRPLRGSGAQPLHTRAA